MLPFHKFFKGSVGDVLILARAQLLAVLLSQNDVHGWQQVADVLTLNTVHPIDVWNKYATKFTI